MESLATEAGGWERLAKGVRAERGEEGVELIFEGRLPRSRAGQNYRFELARCGEFDQCLVILHPRGVFRKREVRLALEEPYVQAVVNGDRLRIVGPERKVTQVRVEPVR